MRMNWQTNKPCLLSKAWQRKFSIICTLSASTLIALSVLLQEAQPVAAVKWFRNDACTDPVPCRESDHTCVGPKCDKHWESCPSGTAQYGNSDLVADEGNCTWTGCGIGGCSEGWEEKEHKDCFLESQCLTHAGFCRNEYCCALRPQVTCCELLPCTPVYDDCQMPERRYPEDSTRRETGTVPIPHQGHADFVFYSFGSVPYGGSCEDVHVLGRCMCEDGRNVPGCEPTDSSSWFVRNATAPDNALPQPPTTPPSPSAAGNISTRPSSPAHPSTTPPPQFLPANLSLTCIVQPPYPPPSPSWLPPDTSTAAATARAEADTSTAALDPNDDDSGSPTAEPSALDQPPPQRTQPTQQASVLPPPLQPKAPRQRRQPSSGPQGGLVAGIVLGCLLLAGCSVGLVLWCCGLCPNWHVLRMQTMTSYEPIFTGQAYNPGLDSRLAHTSSGPLAAAEDIPWSRFCTAIGDAYRRVRYGKRYRDERTDAAAAAERYRALNSLSARRHSHSNGMNHGGEGSDLRKGPTRGAMGAIPRFRNVTNGGPGLYDDQDDDAEVDEFFTLDDLRTGGSYGGYNGGLRLPVSTAPPPLTPAVRRDAPAPIGLWRLGGRTVTAAAPAELEMEAVSRSAQQRGATAADAAPAYSRGADRDNNDVIHTRPLNLSEDEGAARNGRDGGAGGAESDDSDLDAPLHLLPSPQITGRSGRAGGGGGGGIGGGGGKGAR